MNNCNIDIEKKYLDQGHKYIAGIDEVGRGPLAGPVVVACVVMPLDNLIVGVNDSKKLSETKREKLSKEILDKAIAYKIVEISPQVIDEINILNATKQAMKQALDELNIVPDAVLVDAVHIDTDIPQESIIKGDEKSYSIACASIIAKVYRDHLMCAYDSVYPGYNFSKHKGYGTREHIEAIKSLGECPIHRQSFIKNFKKSV